MFVASNKAVQIGYKDVLVGELRVLRRAERAVDHFLREVDELV